MCAYARHRRDRKRNVVDTLRACVMRLLTNSYALHEQSGRSYTTLVRVDAPNSTALDARHLTCWYL